MVFIRMLVILMLSFVAVSAVKGRPYQDPKVYNIVRQFEHMYHVNTSTISIAFKETTPVFPKEAIAYCQGTSAIVIKPSYWNTISPLGQRNVLFHELAHCALLRDHRNDLYPDKCPKSLMYPHLVWDDCYLAHAKAMDLELNNPTSTK